MDEMISNIKDAMELYLGYIKENDAEEFKKALKKGLKFNYKMF